MTADLFPSYILEPKKIIESISWFLNPVEEPPQKFLQVLNEDKGNIFSELLEKEGFIIKNATWDELISNIDNESDTEGKFQFSYYNLAFSLANGSSLENFETILIAISNLLRPSSYFILEMKLNQIDRVRNLFLKVFESVNFLIPWSQLNTNPFSPFNTEKGEYCWIVALTHGSEDDPAEWMESL